MTTQIPRLLTLSEAIRELGHTGPGTGGVSVTTLRNEIAAGRLQARRVARCLRVTDVELRRWALDVPPVPGTAGAICDAAAVRRVLLSHPPAQAPVPPPDAAAALTGSRRAGRSQGDGGSSAPTGHVSGLASASSEGTAAAASSGPRPGGGGRTTGGQP